MEIITAHYEEIAQRLRTYYPECTVTRTADTMTIRHRIGSMELVGLHVSFYTLGEPFGELDFDSPSELYAGLESYIRTLKEEGAHCNQTFISAQNNAGKRSRISIMAGTGAFAGLIAAYYLWELSDVVLWCSMLISLLLPLIVRLAVQYSIRRDWVCPHCGAGLPLQTRQWFPQMEPVTSCPCCKADLLDGALLQSVRQHISSHEADDPKSAPSSSKPTAAATSLPGRRKALVCRLWGAALLVLCGLFTSLLVSDPELTDTGMKVLDAAVLALTAAAGVSLLLSRTVTYERIEQPVLAVFGKKYSGLKAVPVGLFGIILLFAALVLSLGEEPSFGMMLLFSVSALFFIGLSVWLLLAWKNRSVLIYPTHMVSTSVFRRTKNIKLDHISAVRIGSNGTIRFLDHGGRVILSIPCGMSGAVQVVDWIDEQGIPVEQKNTIAQKASQEPEAALAWKPEYGTPMHAHLKSIRMGLILTVTLLILGSVLPLLLFFMKALGVRTTILLTAFAPVPVMCFYVIFATVFYVGSCPKGATDEWRAKHIKFPILLISLFELWVFSQVFQIWQNHFLQVVGFGRMFLMAVIIYALFAVLAWSRTPKYLHTEDFGVLLLTLILVGLVTAYGINLAISKPVEHYPAVVVDRYISPQERRNRTCTLTVLLDDGTTARVNVSEDLYRLHEAGRELVVCQRENILGVRFVQLHVPKGADEHSVSETASQERSMNA